ncbi:hypothetical protein RHMOL_Rhmol01G0274300 [Rhododendron molle]|uniref:Uncharacterized protein n=1 Tax=Rhododendron molle TaxID=49168 RepID=A0ACC0Q7Z6_RHOML|nr:hypothetical protein RHMOL_Rhmol01G0274300 [Rhododendron molle]
MPQPMWLPPLNVHNSYSIHVTANQYDPPPPSSSSPPPPTAAGHEFFIRVNTKVDFFPPETPDSTVDERTIKGLSVWTSFHLPLANVVFDMIDLICSAPFPLDRIHWKSQRIDGEPHASPIEDEYELKETFSNFLWELLTAPCNADRRVLAVTLAIEKIVRLTADEFALWASWYDEQAMSSESFEREYEEAVSRPRGEERGVLPEVVYKGEDGKEKCSICLEEFVVGSRVARLTCSHLYHGDCVLKWLKRSNACPLCRALVAHLSPPT